MSKVFKLEIRCAGAAFEEFPESGIADKLESIASWIRNEPFSSKYQSIFDANGNKCGTWKLGDSE